MMPKFSICNELYEGWPLEKVFAHAAQTGYEGVEIAPFTLADDIREVSAARRNDICASARRHGIEVVGLHWLLLKPPGLHINSPDATIRLATRDYLESLIDLCADLGGKILVFGSPKQRAVIASDHWRETWKRSVEAFTLLSVKARQRGVIIALEPLAARDGCNFINTMVEGSLLISEVNTPEFRLHLDVKAMHGEGRPIADTIRLEGGNLLAHFHANDPNSRGPGMGEMAYEPIARALQDVRYSGWVSVEVFDFTPGAEKTAVQSLKTLRKTFASDM